MRYLKSFEISNSRMITFELIGLPSREEITVSHKEFDELYDRFELDDSVELRFGQWSYKDEDKEEIIDFLEALRDAEKYNL